MNWLRMINRFRIPAILLTLLMGIAGFPIQTHAADFLVYSVYKGVDLGNPNEPQYKDYYVNMGSSQGLHVGSIIEVSRKISTYDLVSEKLYKEVTFPIAKMRIIHAEPNAAIARLDKLLPADSTPIVSPRAVMVGDIVRLVR